MSSGLAASKYKVQKMALTDITIKCAEIKIKDYKISDSGGLYVLVKTNGSKYWRLKYRMAGKEKVLALGVYPEVKLFEAREQALEAKKRVRNNIDPSLLKKTAKLKAKEEAHNSFESIASEWHKNKKADWSPKHAKYVYTQLSANIFPILGKISISDIKAQELLSALRKIEDRDALHVAHKALQTCGQIFRYAIATGRTDRDISVDLRGALKAKKRDNHAHLTEKELPAFFAKLENYGGDEQTKLALKFLILTFTRTSEVRGAKWLEIDFEKKEWRIPADRMKMRTVHIVPLSQQAVEVLRRLYDMNKTYEYVFPNRNRPSAFMSENTMLYAIYRMGYHSRATTHGFRATASTILNENGFAADAIEKQLAHLERDKIRASYNHAQYLPERRKMMEWWGDYIQKQIDNIIYGTINV